MEEAPQPDQEPEVRDGQSSTAYGYTNVVEYHDYRNTESTYYSNSDSTFGNAETIYIEAPNTEHIYMEPPNMEPPNMEPPNMETPNMETPNMEKINLEPLNLEPPNMETPNVEPTMTVLPDIEPIYTEPASPQITE